MTLKGQCHAQTHVVCRGLVEVYCDCPALWILTGCFCCRPLHVSVVTVQRFLAGAAHLEFQPSKGALSTGAPVVDPVWPLPICRLMRLGDCVLHISETLPEVL